MIGGIHTLYEQGITTREALWPVLNAQAERQLSASELDRLLRNALPKESYYQNKILKWLRSEFPHGFVRKLTLGIYSEAGLPDIMAVINGVYYGFEVKRPYIGELTKLQEETIRRIRAAGGYAGVVSFPFEAEAIIRQGGSHENERR